MFKECKGPATVTEQTILQCKLIADTGTQFRITLSDRMCKSRVQLSVFDFVLWSAILLTFSIVCLLVLQENLSLMSKNYFLRGVGLWPLLCPWSCRLPPANSSERFPGVFQNCKICCPSLLFSLATFISLLLEFWKDNHSSLANLKALRGHVKHEWSVAHVWMHIPLSRMDTALIKWSNA